MLWYSLIFSYLFYIKPVFLRRFRDPIRVPRISNRVPRIREIRSLQIQAGFLTFSLKKTWLNWNQMAWIKSRIPNIKTQNTFAHWGQRNRLCKHFTGRQQTQKIMCEMPGSDCLVKKSYETNNLFPFQCNCTQKCVKTDKNYFKGFGVILCQWRISGRSHLASYSRSHSNPSRSDLATKPMTFTPSIT